MRKKGLIICGAAAGIIIALGIAVFVILSRANNPTFAVMFKISPYEKGYKCTGTGDISVGLDIDKLKKIPGFP